MENEIDKSWFEEGAQYSFYGVDGNYFKLDNRVFEAIEDPSDGYRSYLGSIRHAKNPGAIFFTTPIARVQVRTVSLDTFEGFELVDRFNHVWLRVGTNTTTDDYYPFFVYRYEIPKTITPLESKAKAKAPKAKAEVKPPLPAGYVEAVKFLEDFDMFVTGLRKQGIHTFGLSTSLRTNGYAAQAAAVLRKYRGKS